MDPITTAIVATLVSGFGGDTTATEKKAIVEAEVLLAQISAQPDGVRLK